MKKVLLALVLALLSAATYSQTTYYWVGGTAPAAINTGANWNTSLDGSGATRPSSSGATDILVFDGTNVGGATPATGVVNLPVNAGITMAQLKFINNAQVTFARPTSGTSTLNINGGAGDDFVIEAGSSLTINSTVGSIVLAMAAANTGKVSGNFAMLTTLQARIANTTGGNPGSLVFTNGSVFRTNITSASSAYAFGSNSQSSEKWVVFEAGAHLYYEGGFSPMGNNSAFSAIDFRPGSFWHHKASNPLTGFGSFFNRKTFANIIVENDAVLTSDGPIYGIENLTIAAGSSFVPHTSGQTVINGHLTVNGQLVADGASTNEFVMGGNPAVISGSGTVDIPSLNIAAGGAVQLQKNISVHRTVDVYGDLDLGTSTISGDASFAAYGAVAAVPFTGSPKASSFMVTGNSTITGAQVGLEVQGPGIAPGSSIAALSFTGDTIFLSKMVAAGGTGVSLSAGSDGASLRTAHTGGFDPVAGSIATLGTKTYESGISYVINGPTAAPFGISTASTASFVEVGNVTVSAPITTNTSVHVANGFNLQLGKVTIRPVDTVHLLAGASLIGNFNSNNYFVTAGDGATGSLGVLQRDALTGSAFFPVGTASSYLPVTLAPAAASGFAVSAFTGITQEGTLNGTPLTNTQKQTKVDAVWVINRLSGSGTADVKLEWDAALEGTTLATLPDAEIGIITNHSPGWTLPVSTGNNTLNTAQANFGSFGAFGVGAQPPSQPFTYNPIPDKTYGDADFSPGAISLNTSTPIVYASSNPAVATIVGDQVHITGAGTTDITATQAGDGFYAAVNATLTLVVNKAPLTITADDKAKPEGDPNPPLTVTYSGFVYGETAAVLTTPVTVTTTATTASLPGTYPIVASGAAAANYTISYVPGTMTVTPKTAQVITFNALPVKTYGNADFSTGASSNNATIPITYTSSDPSVATVTGSTIHITGAGTTTITASQAGNAFYFPAQDVSRTLTVNKANLIVRVRDTVRAFGEPNPPFTITYTGFVLGENSSNLATAPVATTVATPSTAPGYYAITPGNGVSQNYNFNYVEGRLTILPQSGTDVASLQAYMSSNSTLTLKVFSHAPDLADVVLYDMSGRPVLKKNVFLAEGFMTYTIPVSQLASGLYTISVNGSATRLKKNISIVK